jgi:arylsulfatase
MSKRPGYSHRSWNRLLILNACVGIMMSLPQVSQAQAAKSSQPNILVIMGDDIGWYNTSIYNRGDMGYQTPNIDRIGKEGGMFLSWYAQQSCTAGRAAFITGQSPIRTGLTKVGLPGSDIGLSAKDPTVAQVMKSLGYATGQFGKNHLGDRNDMLPCVHGFDEFFGNLYHLNAEEEPENPDYPKNPQFKQKFGPRGVLHCYATETVDPSIDQQFGKVGAQKIENTGALDTKRMQTVDAEFTNAAMAFMDKQIKAGKPFFCYYNSTRMHIFTHLSPQAAGKTGYGIEADGMVEHDGYVGQLLKKLDDLGIADNTIVVYTSDNGAEMMTWPDGGSTPYRGEKATNFEGGYRVPTLIRWPGVVKPGTVYSQFFAHEDFLPTFAAGAGNPDIVKQCLTNCQLGADSFHVHLDGYNLMPFFKGEVTESPRKEFLYWSDDGDLFAIRVLDWKVSFIEQYHEGMGIWRNEYTRLRIPMIYNLRSDPFERGPNSFLYDDWLSHRAFILVPAQAIVANWLSTFKDYPIRQKPASFNLDDVMRKLSPSTD